MVKVSIIVPIYNVEPYLRRCVDSILAQTYTVFELILVDDGSTDHCPAICDEYSSKDTRIKVIHQVNGGVADARNTGLRAATGEWLAWVDSDDWVSPTFIEYMLTNAMKYDADIVISGRCEEHRNGKYFISPGQRLLNSEAAIKELLKDNTIRNYMWDKLCRARLFQGLTFPNEVAFEDMLICWKLFDRADRILCCPDVNYHYFIHSDGLVGDGTHLYPLLSYCVKQKRRKEISERYPQLHHFLIDDCLCASLTAWSNYYSYDRKEREEHRDHFSEISGFVRQHPPGKNFLRGCGRAQRIVIKLARFDTWWSLFLSGLINYAYSVKNGRGISK